MKLLINLSTTALLLLSSPTMAKTTPSNDVEVLSATMYGESRGESPEGAIAVGHSLATRGKTWVPKKSLAEHAQSAYHPKPVPKQLLGLYRALAVGILNGSIEDVTKGADSFDSVKAKPKGKVTREIGRHRFYIAGQ